MHYTLEFLTNGQIHSEDGVITSDAKLEALILKLDAEKYVSLSFTHPNHNIMTVSGGREQYIVMFSDSNRFYELNHPSSKGGEIILIRTGHTVGKFPPEMVTDPFSCLKILKEFYRTGIRHPDYNWKPLI